MTKEKLEAEVSQEKSEGIAKLDMNLYREDLNSLVEKVNELVETVNNL